MRKAVASIDLERLFRPIPVGEPVNMHVVESVKEPEPDFEAMRRLVEGDEEPETVRDERKTGDLPKDR
jgi:hypothetical protein